MELKVKRIIDAKRRADVYDFETPSHSYVLANGAISHNTQEMYSKDVVSGGTGIYYSSSWIFIIGRSQEKEGDELTGYKFNINIEKSRYVREKSKLPITVDFEKGIKKWSGMMDLAVEMGYVIKPKNGWYTRPCVEGDKSWRFDDGYSDSFWKPIMTNTDFRAALKKKFQLAGSEMILSEEEREIDLESGEIVSYNGVSTEEQV